jgi:hypothetical protein
MVQKQSEIGRDAQLAVLLRHEWQAEIEKAVDKVKLGIVPAGKRTKTDQWFREQWYRSMIRDRKRKSGQNIRSAASPSRLTSTPAAHE